MARYALPFAIYGFAEVEAEDDELAFQELSQNIAEFVETRGIIARQVFLKDFERFEVIKGGEQVGAIKKY